MEYFKIADKYYERLSHYKDRTPPWIKIHNDFLEDYQFSKLSDQKKYHFIASMLLASRSSNKIVYDSDWVRQKINATSKVDLNLFLECGFINKINNENNELGEHASDALTYCKQVATKVVAQNRIEENRKEEKRRDGEENARVPALASPDIFHFKTIKFSTKIKQEYLDELVKNFEGVDVFYELGKMNQWYSDNPMAQITYKSFRSKIRKWMSTARGEVAAVG